MRRMRVIGTLSIVLASIGCSAGGGQPAPGSQPPPPGPAPAAPLPVLGGETPAAVEFRNVRIFDGHSDKLSAPSNVLVKGNRIDTISTEALPVESGSDTTVIDGGGRTLMPGLIDNHWHTMFVRPSPAQLMISGAGYVNLVAGAEAHDTLMRGFTTVRDLGGPSFDLKRAIDEGVIEGPRIFPSGAMITVEIEHFDTGLGRGAHPQLSPNVIVPEASSETRIPERPRSV